jgi:hypothetical protein
LGPISEQRDQYSEGADSSIELQENSRTSYRLREKKVKAPSVALSTSSASSPDSLPDSRKLVIWLDVKESRPRATPKPALSYYNSYKLETDLSKTSKFVAVRKKVEEFVTLSDRYITAGLTIHVFTISFDRNARFL